MNSIPNPAAAILLLLAACSAPPDPPAPLQARSVLELGRWQAYDGERLLGQLIQLEIVDPAGPVRFYQVQDAAGRLVGSATAAGRFSRRVPFQDQEADIGVWSLPRGVARLFDREQAVELRAMAPDAGVNRR